MAYDTSTTIARFLSPPAAFLVAGYSLSFSQNAVPTLYDKPVGIATAIFAPVFYQGASLVVPLSAISASASAYLAYRFPKQRRIFAAAAALSVSLGPWTSLVMLPGISRLLAIGNDVALQRAVESTGEVADLLRTWVMQNYARAAFALSAGMLSSVGIWLQERSNASPEKRS